MLAIEVQSVYSRLLRATAGLVGEGAGPFPAERVATFGTALGQVVELDVVGKLFDLWHWLNDLQHSGEHAYAFKRSVWGRGAALAPRILELAPALSRAVSLAQSANE
jgi:hypothetical protein